MPLLPGYEGKRYALCSDNKLHLVMKVYEGQRVDTLCCENLTAPFPQPKNLDAEMCKQCVAIHFYRIN